MSQANQMSQDQSAKKMICMPIKDEEWREYSWLCPVSGNRVTYKITSGVSVYLYKGCTTHRVLDSAGVVHCVPAVGFYGCALTWKAKKGRPPVAW